MVKDVGDWPWSSYRSALGIIELPSWLDVKWQLSCFGNSLQEARRLYRDYVAQGLGITSPLKEVKNQIYLGSESFVQRMQKAIEGDENLSKVPKIQKRDVAKSLEYYEKNSINQGEAMAKAYYSGSYTMRKIAEYFNVHYATVSRSVKGMRVWLHHARPDTVGYATPNVSSVNKNIKDIDYEEANDFYIGNSCQLHGL
jgi:hypothetical protein